VRRRSCGRPRRAATTARHPRPLAAGRFFGTRPNGIPQRSM
jgi:hypothetical protein